MSFVPLVLLLLVCGCTGRTTFPDRVIKIWSRNIFSTMEYCNGFLFPESDYAREIRNFWDSEYTFADEHIGCIFLCALYINHHIHDDGTLDEGNLRRYFLDARADSETARKLVDIHRNCYRPTTDSMKLCATGFELFTCLHSILNTPEWKPSN